VHELVRRLIARMIEDVIAESHRRLVALAPRSPDDIRRAGSAVVGFSAGMAAADHAIKEFLRPRMYQHPRVARIMGEAEGVVRALFRLYTEAPHHLPAEWGQGLDPRDPVAVARRAGDYIAGMTDRYALIEHRRHFGTAPELR
jgi:dGTPase